MAFEDQIFSDPSFGSLAPGSLGNSNVFSGYVPAYAGGTDTTGTGGGVNWQQLAKGLSSLKDAGGGDKVSNLPGADGKIAGAPLGQPSRPVSMDALLQTIMQRVQSYRDAAMNPQAGVVGQQQRPAGLLGI